MMCPAIDKSASCSIHAVVHFPDAKTRVAWKSIVNYVWFTAKDMFTMKSGVVSHV
jgi:hypothetical protein